MSDAPGARDARGGPVLHEAIATIDVVLDAHAAALGRDGAGYRHHVYRVANLCLALVPDDPAMRERVAVAAVFHDLGIWTAGTFDYLEPSVAAATAYLRRVDRDAWVPEVAAMIREHHRVRPWRGGHPLVEPFRRADWVDVTFGVVTLGIPRPFVAAVRRRWPDAGFHRRLLALAAARARTHPWSPLPMLRL